MKFKRKKKTRYRGNKSHGRGRKNRTRGSGNQGGVGMSGTGKRGDQKKTLVIKLFGNNYFKKDRSVAKDKAISMTLYSIEQNIHGFVKRGIAKEQKGAYELHLEDYKIIGNDDISLKLVIHARAASKGSMHAVQKAGGEIRIVN